MSFITEKDAIKLSDSVPNHVWVLPIRATIQPDLADVLVQKSCSKIKKIGENIFLPSLLL